MVATTLLAASLLLRPLGLTPDPWFGEDKLKHFFTSFVITSFSATGARLLGAEPRASLWVGAGVATGAGLYKELEDARTTSVFSARDLFWDFGGLGAAALLLDAAR